jgi:hypothetical protein
MIGRELDLYELLIDACTQLMETIHRVPSP